MNSISGRDLARLHRLAWVISWLVVTVGVVISLGLWRCAGIGR